jgi:hypothetical protein
LGVVSVILVITAFLKNGLYFVMAAIVSTYGLFLI